MSITYREIPTTVTAMVVPDPNTSAATLQDVHEVATWCAGAVLSIFTASRGAESVIKVGDVEPLAMPGDYIIKGESGNMSICPPAIFPALYELVPA